MKTAVSSVLFAMGLVGYLILAAGCTTVKQAALDVPGLGLVAQRSAGIRIESGDPFVLAMSDRPLIHGDYSFPQVRQWGSNLVVAWATQGDRAGSSRISVDRNGDLLPILETEIRSPALSTNDGLDWALRLPGDLDAQLTNSTKAASYCWHLGFNMIPQPFFGYTPRRDGSIVALQYEGWAILKGEERANWEAVGMGMTYRDGAWSDPYDVLFDIPNVDLTFKARTLVISPRGIELEDGRILIAVASREVFPYKLEGKAAGMPDALATLLFVSDDAGKTFRFYSMVASPKHAPLGYNGPCEPSLIRLKNGEFLCAMRTGAGISSGSQSILFARSSDQGMTWSRFASSRQGVWPVLVQMSNGVVACSYGRTGNRVMFSADDGRTWFKTIVLTPDMQGTSGYTDMIEVSPGRLLVVYDEREYAPPGKKLWDASQGLNAVLGRYIDVTVEGDTAALPPSP